MKLNFRRFSAALWPVLAACALFITGCSTGSPQGASTGAPPAQVSTNTPSMGSDFLAPGDRVIITYSGVSSVLPKHEERIKDDGTINMPLIGDVQAAGFTRRQLEQVIHDKYVPGIYKTLTITVAGEERFFYVDGQVRSPGRHPYLGGLTLLRAVAAAGDFTDFANRRKVQVTRASGQKVVINCTEARDNNKLDIPIYADDQIFVPRRVIW